MQWLEEDLQRGVGQNPSWDLCKPGGQLQDISDLCDFFTTVELHFLHQECQTQFLEGHSPAYSAPENWKSLPSEDTFQGRKASRHVQIQS